METAFFILSILFVKFGMRDQFLHIASLISVLSLSLLICMFNNIFLLLYLLFTILKFFCGRPARS